MDSDEGAEALPPARCRIRASTAHSRLTAPRGLSQPTTPFIGSWRQGIPRTPFAAPRALPRARGTRRILRQLLDRLCTCQSTRTHATRLVWLVGPHHATTPPRPGAMPSDQPPLSGTQKNRPASRRPVTCLGSPRASPSRSLSRYCVLPAARSCLSSIPDRPRACQGVELGRFELPTSRVQGGRSPTKLQPRSPRPVLSTRRGGRAWTRTRGLSLIRTAL